MPGTRLLEGSRIHDGRVDLERHDVRDDLRRVEPEPGYLHEALREALRVRVVLGEPSAHLLERDESGRRDDAGLTHRATEQLAHTARLRDRLGVAADDGTDRRGEALREAELHGVDVLRECLRIDAERGRRVEDARTVEMDTHPARMGEVRDLFRLRWCDDRTAAVVV